MVAEIHGFATFRIGTETSRVFDRLNASDPRFKVFESEPRDSFQWQYVSFAGEARILGESDGREWLEHVESRLREINFFSVVMFISYEDASIFQYAYFKGDNIERLVSEVDEQPISKTIL